MKFLFVKDDEPMFRKDGVTYTIQSHPAEPCTYLVRQGAVVCALRCGFETQEVLGLLRDKRPLVSVTGRAIDEPFLCEVLAAALEDGRSSMDFPFAEGLADRRLERLRLAHRIEATRDSVCMGDDCHAPHAEDLLFWDETLLSEFLATVGGYVPAMRNASWRVMDQERTLGHLVSGEDARYSVRLELPDGPFKDIGSEEIFCRYGCGE